MRILRVDMDELRVSYDALPEHWELFGGRGLIAKIMNSEVSPNVDPLDGRNRLIIAGGPLAGTLAPQLGRISIGAKSPLTLGIKEANAGGPAAQRLDRLDIRAIVVKGLPKDKRFYFLEVFKEGANLIPADQYQGMKNYELVEAIYKNYGRRVSVICIGIGGRERSQGSFGFSYRSFR